MQCGDFVQAGWLLDEVFLFSGYERPKLLIICGSNLKYGDQELLCVRHLFGS